MQAQTKAEDVTKEWLANKLQNEADRSRILGRALLAIYKQQTLSEQNSSNTRISNGIGFAKPDARVGSIGARMYSAHAKLEQWCIDVWMRPARDGKPRICKYAAQLQEIARAAEVKLNVNHAVIL